MRASPRAHSHSARSVGDCIKTTPLLLNSSCIVRICRARCVGVLPVNALNSPMKWACVKVTAFVSQFGQIDIGFEHQTALRRSNRGVRAKVFGKYQ